MGKSAQELEREVTSGRFPPSILIKVIYTSPEEKRKGTALMMVDVNGASVPLSFSCRVKEEVCESECICCQVYLCVCSVASVVRVCVCMCMNVYMCVCVVVPAPVISVYTTCSPQAL